MTQDDIETVTFHPAYPMSSLVRLVMLSQDAQRDIDNFDLRSENEESVRQWNALLKVDAHYATALIRLVQEHGDTIHAAYVESRAPLAVWKPPVQEA